MIPYFCKLWLTILVLLITSAGYSQDINTKLNTKELADAIEKHDFTAIQQLMQQRKLRADNITWGKKEDFMPLVFSVGFRLDDVTSELLGRKNYANLHNTEGNRALERACQLRDRVLVEKLIKQGADVNAESEYGSPVLFSILDDFGLVKLFVENGADINLRSKNPDMLTCAQTTALHHAAVWSSIQIITYLVEKGAKVNDADANGWTPLHYAAYGGNTDVVVYLLSQGADKNAKTTMAWEILTNMMQNPYPARSTPLEIAKVSATNHSFYSKRSEFHKILFYLSETKDQDLIKTVSKIRDSLPAGWDIKNGEAFSDEFVIQSSLIELEPDMTSNDPFEVKDYCRIFIKMLPRVSPDSIYSLRKANARLQSDLPPQNSKDNINNWSKDNQQILKVLDSEPTHFDNNYSYRIKCRRIPKNDKYKTEYNRIMTYLNAQFTKYSE
jgi:ankyrin repeat protein